MNTAGAREATFFLGDRRRRRRRLRGLEFLSGVQSRESARAREHDFRVSRGSDINSTRRDIGLVQNSLRILFPSLPRY